MRHSAWSAMSVLAVACLNAACAAPSASTGPQASGVVPGSPFGTQAAAMAPAAAAAPATQWVISCQPYQQAQIRNTFRDGVQVAEVTCADTNVQQAVGSARSVAPVPVMNVASPAGSDDIVSLDDEVVTRPRRTVRAQPAVYTIDEPRERPVRRVEPKRSVAKSAVIIGSSAGAGAGIGALLGGKKGALIGAAVGGGGAAVWDQVTRRK